MAFSHYARPSLLNTLMVLVLTLAFQYTQIAMAQVNSGYLAGNRQVTLEICDGTDGSSPLRRYIHFVAQGLSTLTVNGVPGTGQQGGNTADLPANQSCMTANVVSSGVPSAAFPTTSATVYFVGCIVYPPPAGVTCNSGSNTGFRMYELVYPTNPVIQTLTPNSITTEGNRDVVATLYPPLAATDIEATCVGTNGVQVSVPPAAKKTNFSGMATHTVSTTVLHVPAPPGTPSGSCTFSLSPTYPATKVLPLAATTVLPNISVLPSTISLAGNNIPVVATISPVHPVARVTIDATCNATIAKVSPVPPGSAQTDAAGKATVRLNVSGLVNVNPNQNIKPTAACTYKIRNTNKTATVSFTTANACTFADLQPRPAACGNPTN